MRRAAAALLGTTIGTALLVGAKIGSHTSGDTHNVGIDTPGVGADGGLDPGVVPPGTPAGTAPATSPGGKSTPTPGTRTTPGGAKTTTKPTAPATGGLRNGTYTGASATYEHGSIRVTITVSAGRITKATATYPTSPARSATINNNAIPKLNQETLVAQSAQIATVSGATLTSGAYRTSLQSALDRADG